MTGSLLPVVAALHLRERPHRDPGATVASTFEAREVEACMVAARSFEPMPPQPVTHDSVNQMVAGHAIQQRVVAEATTVEPSAHMLRGVDDTSRRRGADQRAGSSEQISFEAALLPVSDASSQARRRMSDGTHGEATDTRAPNPPASDERVHDLSLIHI